jgi:hypothetical protein
LGQFRDLPDDTRRLIAAWAGSINAPEVPPLFRRELKIEEAGIEYWVPVQEVLVSYMKAELHPREVIELFILFIGQVDGRHGASSTSLSMSLRMMIHPKSPSFLGTRFEAHYL